MTNNTPSGAKRHRKSTEPESCQMAKMFYTFIIFFFFFFFFFFRRASSNLRDMCSLSLSAGFVSQQERMGEELKYNHTNTFQSVN